MNFVAVLRGVDCVLLPDDVTAAEVEHFNEFISRNFLRIQYLIHNRVLCSQITGNTVSCCHLSSLSNTVCPVVFPYLYSLNSILLRFNSVVKPRTFSVHLPTIYRI